MKIVIQIVLWAVIGFLGYMVFNSIYEPVKFNKLKEERYQKVIKNLKDIRSSQLAYKEVNGVFAKDFPSLVRFIDTAEFVITERRDTTFLDEEYKRRYNVDQYKEAVVIDTLGYTSIKDSLFKDGARYKTMMNVPIEGVDEQFELESGTVVKNDIKLPVFEAKVAKNVILYDQDKDLLAQENEIVSVDGVNGRYLRVGSLTDVNSKGNWPKNYGANDE